MDDYRWMDLAEEAGQLHEALSTRAPIEQAKGVIALMRGCDTGAAFEELRRVSMHHNVRLQELCVVLVDVVAGKDVSGHSARLRQAVFAGWAAEIAAIHVTMQRDGAGRAGG